jgi:hypothetical protein
MSYPPEADMVPEWKPTPKLSDYEAEALLEYERRKEWNTSPSK